MRRQKPFSEYPGWILNVVERARSGERLVQLDMPDRGTAISSTHMFNRARSALVRESAEANPALAEAALDIVARVVNLEPSNSGKAGRYVIEFVSRGLAIAADELRGTRRGMASPLRGDSGALADLDKMLAGQALDEHDKGLASAFGLDLTKPGQVSNTAAAQCAHEADIYGLVCVKCGSFIAEPPSAQ